jgi:hypothetical protein
MTERHEVSLATSAEDRGEDTRKLALAVLSLFSEARYEGQGAPLLIEHAPASEDDDFDFG